MRISQSRLRIAASLGLLAVTGSMVGCAHVNRDDLGVELAQIRQELKDGDQDVAQRTGARIDGVEARLDGVEGRLDMMEQDLSALQSEFNVVVERLETATRFNMPVYFGFNQADLNSGDVEVLQRFSQVVQEHFQGSLVTVEGFTDPAGTRAYNIRLGQRRANAVRDYLVGDGGLPGDRVRAVSYGEETDRQVAKGASKDAGQLNRRVVMVIDHAAQNTASAVITASTTGN